MSREYFVPDYYPGFACKCGDCRSSCCKGWPVIITGEEYTRLQAAECSPAFRQKLEAAVNLDGDPRKGGTAHIVHDRSGACPLMNEAGLCTLQLELGEAILPDVCRLYPRNTREVCGHAECACAASCEAVVEKLLNRPDALSICTLELEEEPRFLIDMSERFYRECRTALVEFRQGWSLSGRFTRLNDALFHQKTGEDADFNGLRLVYAMTAHFAKNSPVAGSVCRRALETYGAGEDLRELEARYAAARLAGREVLPNWNLDLANLILNSMFYNSFPHVGGTNTEEDPLLSIAVTAAFVDFVLMGCLREGDGRNEAVDVISTLFRLIEHSDFKYRAVKYYREWGDRSPGTWLGMVKRIET